MKYVYSFHYTANIYWLKNIFFHTPKKFKLVFNLNKKGTNFYGF